MDSLSLREVEEIRAEEEVCMIGVDTVGKRELVDDSRNIKGNTKAVGDRTRGLK